MAVDDAILEAVRLGASPPTLRLYTWDRPTISLGRTQRLWPAPGGFEPAGAPGYALVRRPTGGRAVLHGHDVTYAVALTGLPASVSASYAILAEGLRQALALLGLPGATLGQERAAGPLVAGRGPACFAAATAADLCVDGLKVLGSAQVRRAGALLQHGSLYPAPLSVGTAVPLATGTPLAHWLGQPPGADNVATALATGLGEVLGLVWEPGRLSDVETAQALASLARFELDTTDRAVRV